MERVNVDTARGCSRVRACWRGRARPGAHVRRVSSNQDMPWFPPMACRVSVMARKGAPHWWTSRACCVCGTGRCLMCTSSDTDLTLGCRTECACGSSGRGGRSRRPGTLRRGSWVFDASGLNTCCQVSPWHTLCFEVAVEILIMLLRVRIRHLQAASHRVVRSRRLGQQQGGVVTSIASGLRLG